MHRGWGSTVADGVWGQCGRERRLCPHTYVPPYAVLLPSYLQPPLQLFAVLTPSCLQFNTPAICSHHQCVCSLILRSVQSPPQLFAVITDICSRHPAAHGHLPSCPQDHPQLSITSFQLSAITIPVTCNFHPPLGFR